MNYLGKILQYLSKALQTQKPVRKCQCDHGRVPEVARVATEAQQRQQAAAAIARDAVRKAAGGKR